MAESLDWVDGISLNYQALVNLKNKIEHFDPIDVPLEDGVALYVQVGRLLLQELDEGFSSDFQS